MVLTLHTGICICFVNRLLAFFCIRYGYFGRATPEVVRLMFCNVSGCLTEGRIFLSVSGEEMVSINTRDTMGIRMLQREEVEVGNL